MKIITILGETLVIEQVEQLEKDNELVAIGERHVYDAVSNALDSPIGAQEIKDVLEIVKLGFETGASFIAFIAAIKHLLLDTDSSVTILNKEQKQMNITASTESEEIQTFLKQSK